MIIRNNVRTSFPLAGNLSEDKLRYGKKKEGFRTSRNDSNGQNIYVDR